MTGTTPTNADQQDPGHDHGHQHDHDQAPDLSQWEQDERERQQPYDPARPVPRASQALTLDESDMGHGWVAVEAIMGDGSTAFWLVDPDQPPGGVWNANLAPHEQTGPLPQGWTRRVGLTCGAISPHTGKPCRNSVKADSASGYCSRHTAAGDA